MLIKKSTLSLIPAEIAIWQISETVEELLQYTANVLKFNAKGTSPAHPEKMLQFLASRAALMNLDIPLTHLDKNETGQPFIRGADNFHISLSHSGCIGVAIKSRCATGVDVELISNKAEKVYPRFGNDNDQKIVKTMSKKLDKYCLLTLLWSIKEAVYKAASALKLNFKQDIFIEEIDINTQAITGIVLKNDQQIAFIGEFEISNDYLWVGICIPNQ
jgi:4'-phosphopantetheinyl transferase